MANIPDTLSALMGYSKTPQFLQKLQEAKTAAISSQQKGPGGSEAEKSEKKYRRPKTQNVKHQVHLRKAAGKIWNDKSLDEWDEHDHRIFVGDLGNEVTDDILTNAFKHYPSFLKAKVIRDKRTTKTKGYGFVSFRTPEDMLSAIKEMHRKYIGNRPVCIRKSNWDDREISSDKNKAFDELISIVPDNQKSLKKFKVLKKPTPPSSAVPQTDAITISAPPTTNPITISSTGVVTGGSVPTSSQWKPRRFFGHPAAFGVTLEKVLKNSAKAKPPKITPGAAMI